MQNNQNIQNQEEQNQEQQQDQEETIEERLEVLDLTTTILACDYFSNQKDDEEVKEIDEDKEHELDEEVNEDEEQEEEREGKGKIEQQPEEMTIEDKLDDIEDTLYMLYYEYLDEQGELDDDKIEDDDILQTKHQTNEARLSILEDIAFILCQPLLEKNKCIRRYLKEDEKDDHCLRCYDCCDMLFIVDSYFYTTRRSDR